MAQLGISLPSRPASSHSRPSVPPHRQNHDDFMSTSPIPSDSELDEDSPLPFPAALSRSDFLAPDFDAAEYLSALHTGGPASRHQTLEDLRAELRDRGAAINAELIELVNAHYASFLGLGDELQGGGDRVGDVRVALMGFRRQLDELRAKVREKRAEVGQLTTQLQGVRSAVEMGRKMLELDERISALESRLSVGSVGKGKSRVDEREGDDDDEGDDWGDNIVSSDEGEEEEGEVEFVCSSPAKLANLAKECRTTERIANSLGRDLPYVRKMEERMMRCRNTILLDLSTALKEARKAGPRGQGRLLKYLAIYRLLDAQADAVRALKEK
ncbi:uncharacterized protein CTHT_0024930 [Thermochaetoides thermophila DSM 1495]|uniref:Conserved oligomeric Golgi complex subunit 2 n=1 Tax=Chaetomium thermophilum (strain DSM 1495 / CBS 144.50 / IMI 039719) TaxID=759272 RepID=G0S5N8_CHATD|nr:hypothetical protein CTHT_0024930 [Thermochaetoides thermophila DSM 1495]EGS20657.1 hypothetical protein CTHT_0024930 [Thermochaetoides thermophila DSM 1495]